MFDCEGLPLRRARDVVLLLLMSTGAAARQQAFTVPPVNVTAIELVADVRDATGNVPSDLKPSDFMVLEDGQRKPVIAVDYLRSASPQSGAPDAAAAASRDAESRWQVVIYFDLYLSDAPTLRAASEAIAERAEELARMGQVDVIAADPAPVMLLAGSRDPAAIRSAISAAASRRSQNWLVRHRRQYQWQTDHEFRGRGPAETWLDPQMAAEIEAIGKFRSSLLDTLGRYPAKGTRALVLVSDGFDLDVAGWYLQFGASRADAMRLRAQYELGSTAQSLARTLSAADWVTIAVHGTLSAGEQWIDDAGRTSIGRVSGSQARGPTFAAAHADEPLQVFAEATGGSSGTPSRLGSEIDSLRQRVVITYQVSRPPDGRLRKVEVRSGRPSLTVRTLHWISESTPEEIAASRAAALLHGGTAAAGDLPGTASIRWTGHRNRRRIGEVALRTSLTPLIPFLREHKGVFRVTIAAAEAGGHPFITHRVVPFAGGGDEFAYRAPIEANRKQLDVAVTVEELTTGMWGGQRARE